MLWQQVSLLMLHYFLQLSTYLPPHLEKMTACSREFQDILVAETSTRVSMVGSNPHSVMEVIHEMTLVQS